MNESIIANIDQQIALLQQARIALTGNTPTRRGPGRPKITDRTAFKSIPVKKTRKRSVKAAK